jgi:hypothetical protein
MYYAPAVKAGAVGGWRPAVVREYRKCAETATY